MSTEDEGRVSNGLGGLLHKLPGREADAEAAYREAIAAGSANATYNLGLLLAPQPGRGAEAEALLRTALAAGDESAWNTLGNLFSRQPDRRDEAIEALRQAVRVGARGAEFRLGMLLLADGRADESLHAYEASRDAGDPGAWVLLAALILGAADLGDPARAAALIDISPELEERYREEEAWAELAQLLALQGRVEDAEACLREAAYAGELQALQGVALLRGESPW